MSSLSSMLPSTSSGICRWAPALLLILAPGCPTRPAAPRMPKTVTITVLSTNDIHGQLEPLALYTREDPPRRYRVGGAEALAATIASLRAENPDGTVLVDAGDFMQGTLVSDAFEGLPLRDLFALLRYDAVVIGNHEFDFGPRGPRPYLPGSGLDPVGALKAWAADAPFPVLSANIVRRDGQPLGWTNVRPSVILRRRGLAIGVIGVTTPQTATTTMPAHVEQLRFDPMVIAVRKQAHRLRASGVALVLVVAHAGGECSQATGDGRPRCRGEVFSDLVNLLASHLVDAVVAGHTHRCIWHRTRSGIAVIEAGGRGVAVASLRLEVYPRDNRVISARPRPPTIACHDLFSDTGDCEGGLRSGPAQGRVIPNPLLAAHHGEVGRARKQLEQHLARLGPRRIRVIARAARHMRHRRPGASEVGTLVARAMVQAVPGADFALVNSGSLRADIAAGPITAGMLHGVFPFDNRLATVTLSGRQVEQLVGTLLANGHGIPQVAGLRLGIRCAPLSHPGAPRRGARTGARGKELSRLVDARSGNALEPERPYTVVLSDFLLAGGDSLGSVFDAIPGPQKRVFANRLVRDEVARYLETLTQPIDTVDRAVLTDDSPAITIEDSGCTHLDRVTDRLCR